MDDQRVITSLGPYMDRSRLRRQELSFAISLATIAVEINAFKFFVLVQIADHWRESTSCIYTDQRGVTDEKSMHQSRIIFHAIILLLAWVRP